MKLIEGKPVFDGKKAISLIITDGDVKKAARLNQSHCAAAVACMRQLEATDVRVHLSRTFIKIKGKWTRFRTSRALRSEIIAFDRGGTMEAGEYELGPMSPSDSNRSARAESDKANKKPRGEPRRPMHMVGGIRPSGKAKE